MTKVLYYWTRPYAYGTLKQSVTFIHEGTICFYEGKLA